MSLLNEGVLLAVRPRFATAIFAKTKTVELRRVLPRLERGTIVAIYEASPTMALSGFLIVDSLQAMPPKRLWPKVAACSLVSQTEYQAYFTGARQAVAIHIRESFALSAPIPLARFRAVCEDFRPPQSFRYFASLPKSVQRLIDDAYGQVALRYRVAV